MTLKEAREAYAYFSQTLSTINRQLALAGIAIIWFFVQPAQNHSLDFGSFKWSFIFFSAALFSDLLHYGIATQFWGAYSLFQERRNKTEFTVPSWLNWPAIGMMYSKVISTIIGYALLIIVLF